MIELVIRKWRVRDEGPGHVVFFGRGEVVKLFALDQEEELSELDSTLSVGAMDEEDEEACSPIDHSLSFSQLHLFPREVK